MISYSNLIVFPLKLSRNHSREPLLNPHRLVGPCHNVPQEFEIRDLFHCPVLTDKFQGIDSLVFQLADSRG